MSGNVRRRLADLETVWARSRPAGPRRFDPALLTEDELAELLAIDRKAAQVGLDALSDAEIERAADLSEKALGKGGA